MPAVKLIVVHSQKAWTLGRIRKRFAVTYTDEKGVDETHILMPVLVDENTAALQGLDDLIAKEKRKYVSMIREGISVIFADAQWQPQTELFKSIIQMAFKGDKDDPLLINIVGYVDGYTDAQLRNAFEKTQPWVTNIRAKVLNVQAMAVAKDGYTPEDIS